MRDSNLSTHRRNVVMRCKDIVQDSVNEHLKEGMVEFSKYGNAVERVYYDYVNLFADELEENGFDVITTPVAGFVQLAWDI